MKVYHVDRQQVNKCKFWLGCTNFFIVIYHIYINILLYFLFLSIYIQVAKRSVMVEEKLLSFLDKSEVNMHE